MMSISKVTVIHRIHKTTGIMALGLISSFFTASIYGEILGDHDTIVCIKTYVVFAIPILLILMPTCAITGKRLAKNSKSPFVKMKKDRLKIIAFNAVILIVLALVLYKKAINNEMNNSFLLLQIAELFVGLTNIIMLNLMIRDGRSLKKTTLKPSAH